MDKIVWIDKAGSHAIVGNSGRLEKKYRELIDRQDVYVKIVKIDRMGIDRKDG